MHKIILSLIGKRLSASSFPFPRAGGGQGEGHTSEAPPSPLIPPRAHHATHLFGWTREAKFRSPADMFSPFGKGDQGGFA